MITITYRDALAALRAAVAEKGAEYVYPKRQQLDTAFGSCVYRTEDNKPSCIVGNALVRLGVQVEDLPSPDGGQVNTRALFGFVHDKKSHLPDVQISRSAATLFDEAQRYQDEGTPWGEAVELAVLNVPEGTS